MGLQVMAHCRLSLPQKARSTNIAARPTSLTPRVRYHHGRAFSSSVSACRSAHSCAITDGVPPSFSHTDTLEFRRGLVHVLSRRRWSTPAREETLVRLPPSLTGSSACSDHTRRYAARMSGKSSPADCLRLAAKSRHHHATSDPLEARRSSTRHRRLSSAAPKVGQHISQLML